MKYVLFLTILLVSFSKIDAQQTSFSRWDLPVIYSNSALKYAWSGGINSPQFSRIDLNRDGIEDMYLFDRAGEVSLVLRGLGNDNYAIDFALAALFPPLKDWALVRDFNKDGAPDIICANTDPSDNAIQVFKGRWTGNTLLFDKFYFHYQGCVGCDHQYIYYPSPTMPGNWSNLVVSSADLPSVTDNDGDGDLDILTFDPETGGNVWLVKNMSVERGFGIDSLQFILADQCYGQMYESGIAACVCKLSGLPDTCVENFQGADPIRHPGSTLMEFDQEGDGDNELVMGDISFDCLNFLKNGGTAQNGWMTEQDTSFPKYDIPVKLTSFPAAFYLDVDGDGNNDMLVSPNSKNITDDDNSVWYYRNEGSNTNHVFRFQTNNLWQDQMIDLGTSTHPTLADVNADGLLDLVAGNQGYYTIGANNVGNPNNSSLYLYLNTGTATSPQFTLSSRNWLNFGQFAPADFDFAPAFGDLDNDGDLDLVVGSGQGYLYYCENTAGAGNSMQFTNPLAGYNWMQIDIGTSASPVIFDLDGDGKKDLLIGERAGNINYFKNVGTPSQALFVSPPTIQNLGAIDTRTWPSVVGYSTPVVLTCPGAEPRLLAGNDIGNLEWYNKLITTSDSIPRLTETWGNTDSGERAHPALGDLDNDGVYELIVGNSRGGFELYKTNLQTDCNTTNTTGPLSSDLYVTIQPNPSATGIFQVVSNLKGNSKWQVFDILGQKITSGSSAEGNWSVILPESATGVYLFSVESNGIRYTTKLLVAQ